MKKLFYRIALKFFTDSQITTLYTSVQIDLILRKQQTLLQYWIEEGTVAGMTDTALEDWAERQRQTSIPIFDDLVAVRSILMMSRPRLFRHHNSVALEHIDVTDRWMWQSRPTYKKYKAIMDEREAQQSKRRP